MAEFWNTVSNVFIFAPPVFGIADALYQGGAKFNCEFHNLINFLPREADPHQKYRHLSERQSQKNY